VIGLELEAVGLALELHGDSFSRYRPGGLLERGTEFALPA